MINRLVYVFYNDNYDDRNKLQNEKTSSASLPLTSLASVKISWYLLNKVKFEIW